MKVVDKKQQHVTRLEGDAADVRREAMTLG
jgi:hypothetical protein